MKKAKLEQHAEFLEMHLSLWIGIAFIFISQLSLDNWILSVVIGFSLGLGYWKIEAKRPLTKALQKESKKRQAEREKDRQ